LSSRAPTSRSGRKPASGATRKEFVIRPNLDLNYARRIGEKIGINFNYRFSERYDDSPRTEISWNQGAAFAPTFWTAPVMEQYNIRTEQKLTHREAFATKLDYNLSDATRISFSGQWNWYDLHFHQRGPQLVLGTAPASVSRTGPADNPTFVSTAPTIRNDVLFRNKYGTTLHFNGTISHDFSRAGKIWASAYWSYADGQYRDIQKGFVGSTASLNAGVVTGMTLANATKNELPTLALTNAGGPVSIDAIRTLSNYNIALGGGNLQARPWTTHENKKGFNVNHRFDIPGLEAVPISIQTGFAFDKTERDITRLTIRASGATINGAALAAIADQGFTKDLAFGFGPYQVVDPYKTYAAYANSFGFVFEDLYREFIEDNTAAYLRADVRPFKDLLLIGGARWEEREIDGVAYNRASSRSLRAPTTLKYSRLYPSLTFKYTPSYMKSLVARGGISKTVGHPDYADLIGTVTAESTTGARDGTLVQVNPGISPYFTTNLDLAFDYYLKNSGVVTFTVFKKNVKNFIVRRGMTQAEIDAAAAAAGVSANQFTSGAILYNGPDSGVQGLEIGYAQTLSFLPRPFNGLNVQFNFTVTDIDGDNNDVLWAQQRGAAPKTANFVLGYRFRKFSVTTSTNWTGDTVASGLVNSEWIRGTANANPALDTQMVSLKDATTRTDIKAEYAFSPRYKVYAAVQNIFGEGRYDYWRGYLPANSAVTLDRNHFQFGEPYYNLGIRGTF
jgi:iron complex outermembrane recepter protein